MNGRRIQGYPRNGWSWDVTVPVGASSVGDFGVYSSPPDHYSGSEVEAASQADNVDPGSESV